MKKLSLDNPVKKKRQTLDGKLKTTGISLTEGRLSILKQYSELTEQSVSKIIMDSLDFDLLLQEIERLSNEEG